MLLLLNQNGKDMLLLSSQILLFCPAKIYAGEGACQFIFLKANDVCSTSYKDETENI